LSFTSPATSAITSDRRSLKAVTFATDLEFTESRKPPKSEALQKFDQTIAMVIATIEKQSESEWTAPFSGDAIFKNRPNAFLRLDSITTSAGSSI